MAITIPRIRFAAFIEGSPKAQDDHKLQINYATHHCGSLIWINGAAGFLPVRNVLKALIASSFAIRGAPA